MLAQRRPDEQVYIGPTSVSNVGPTESTTEKLRWANVVMLSGYISVWSIASDEVIDVLQCPMINIYQPCDLGSTIGWNNSASK